MSFGSYWFTGWRDANGVKTADQAVAVLEERSAFEEFVAVAQSWRTAILNPPPYPDDAASDDGFCTSESIVAGPGLAPTFEEHCTHPGCVVQTLERLLNVSLLYYEEIIMPDEIGDAVCSRSAILSDKGLAKITKSGIWLDDDTRDAIRKTITVLDHIERVGADELIRFTPTADYVVNEEDWYALVRNVRQYIRGGLRYEWHGKNNSATVYHEDRDHSWLFTFMYGDQTPEQDLALVADNLLPRYLRELIVTFSNCTHFNAPLGNLDRFYDRLQAHALGNERKVAPLFSMPSLEHVPAAEVVNLRLQYPDVFARIRNDLSLARDIASNGADPAAVFDIKVLQPAFREIEKVITEYSQKLRREIGFSLATSIPTICSLYLGAPKTTAQQVAAVSGIIASVLKGPASAYMEKRQHLAKNPYYFLWQSAHSK